MRQHPIDRTLTLLNAATPEESRAALADLNLGQRDARLLTLREEMFGSAIAGIESCQHCGKVLELQVSIAELLESSTDPDKPAIHDLVTEDMVLKYRLPTSRDLAIVVNEPNAEKARNILVRHCIQDINRSGVVIEYDDLSDETIDLLAASLSENDPLAEIMLEAHCPDCEHNSRILLDIGEFFWVEFNSLARRLLQEVRILATAFHWSESEILGMSTARRRTYLEMVAT